MMDQKRFAYIGRSLYGPHWRSPLARALGLSLSQLTSYRDGAAEIPRKVALASQYLIEHYHEALDLGLSPQAKARRKLYGS